MGILSATFGGSSITRTYKATRSIFTSSRGSPRRSTWIRSSAITTSRTAPEEPIFVYPTSPLLYVLSQRRNPTRFDHLNPGAASPADIDQVIADIQSSHVPVVVVSDFWEGVWGSPGANAVLETWIDAHYREVARHGAYRVLTAGL